MMDALDALRNLPGTAQTRGEDDFIDVDSQTMNLPALRPDGTIAGLDPDRDLVAQVADLAGASWVPQPWLGRWRWAHSLPAAIREGDATTFRHLIMSGLAHGFDGVKVSPGEFEVALLEFDLRRAGAR